MSNNYYEILGVGQISTDAQIRRAAQAAKDQIAADASLAPAERDSRLTQVQTAADVLMTPEKRDRYDATLHRSPTREAGSVSSLMRAPVTWIVLCATAAIGAGLYWQYDRDQMRQHIERQRVAAEEQQERRAKEIEEKRLLDKQKLLEELRAQRETDDKLRQQFNEIRSADSQKKQYVADDRYMPPPPSNYTSNYESARRNYEDQRQLGSDAQQRIYEEQKQRYEDAANLQRAQAEVARQKRYLEQLEREEQYSRANREAASKPRGY